MWASLQPERLSLDDDAEPVYVGAMFHDVGSSKVTGPKTSASRSTGASAARAFLERRGMPEKKVMTVWQAIALHTTRQVPNYLQPEVRLVAVGVEYDVLDCIGAALGGIWPRTRISAWKATAPRPLSRRKRLVN